MKKIFVFFTALFLTFMIAVPSSASNQTACESALLSLMWDDIQAALTAHHSEIKDIQSFDEKVVELKMTNGLSFEITIQLDAFVGAHNTIGTDTLKFIREVPDGLKLVSYKHKPTKKKKEILEWYFKN
ncbi:DUF3888 domain-containing protein [Oceanobacillus sp. FSL H7-0719]|uniref:DUF3888 domain-containing protein n=1 Tax=Oceanobacillus sp. FSL H7-0719 TaxID=2954507 RepID=UPI00324D8FD4